MFMRENRRKNGAPQPEQTAKADASRQRAARKLSPNSDLPSSGEDCRFTPSMGTSAQINEQHYDGGINDGGPFKVSYEQHIPSVGIKVAPTGPGRDLKSR
jgi:hypothetical protein